MILSIALVYSTSPPVSVSGTVFNILYLFPEHFLFIIPSSLLESLLVHVVVIKDFPSKLTLVSLLGTVLLQVDNPCLRTLGVSATVFFTYCFSLLISTLILLICPMMVLPSSLTNYRIFCYPLCWVIISAIHFSLLIFSIPHQYTSVSCYAFLKWWLLPSLHPNEFFPGMIPLSLSEFFESLMDERGCFPFEF